MIFLLNYLFFQKNFLDFYYLIQYIDKEYIDIDFNNCYFIEIDQEYFDCEEHYIKELVIEEFVDK